MTLLGFGLPHLALVIPATSLPAISSKLSRNALAPFSLQAALMAKMKAVQAAFESASSPPPSTAPDDDPAGPISPVRTEASLEAPPSPRPILQNEAAHQCVLCSGDANDSESGPLGLVVSTLADSP